MFEVLGVARSNLYVKGDRVRISKDISAEYRLFNYSQFSINYSQISPFNKLVTVTSDSSSHDIVATPIP
jgi:hypothetical protein